VVLLLIPSCRLSNFGTAGRVCFSPPFFFLSFLCCCCWLVPFNLAEILASPTKGNVHRYTPETRETHVSLFPDLVRSAAHASPSLLFSDNNNSEKKKKTKNKKRLFKNQKEITGGMIIGPRPPCRSRNVIQSWSYFNGIFFNKIYI